MASALTFLECYHKDGDECLNHIIQLTGDETYVLFVNVETKEQSKHWIYTHSPNKPKNFKQMLSARKLMATTFWDRKGVLMMEFMQQGTTILSEGYCETLKKLSRAIQNKRHGMLTYGVVLLHDNHCLHTVARTQALLEHFSWELFDYPPCSPGLAPSNYHLVTYRKNWLRYQNFNNNEQLIKGVKTWLSLHAADFFDTHTTTYSPVQQVPQFQQ
jgi:hypothetical protein